MRSPGVGCGGRCKTYLEGGSGAATVGSDEGAPNGIAQKRSKHRVASSMCAAAKNDNGDVASRVLKRQGRLERPDLGYSVPYEAHRAMRPA